MAWACLRAPVALLACLAGLAAVAAPASPPAPLSAPSLAAPAASAVASLDQPASAPLTPPASERESHTALCVAALDVRTRQLAQQVKAGLNDVRPQLLTYLKSGTAFVGTAYLAGNRDEDRSRALLDAALEAQKLLTAQELSARQAACHEEGTRLLADSNVLKRALVDHLATKRMKRLLSD